MNQQGIMGTSKRTVLDPTFKSKYGENLQVETLEGSASTRAGSTTGLENRVKDHRQAEEASRQQAAAIRASIAEKLYRDQKEQASTAEKARLADQESKIGIFKNLKEECDLSFLEDLHLVNVRSREESLWFKYKNRVFGVTFYKSPAHPAAPNQWRLQDYSGTEVFSCHQGTFQVKLLSYLAALDDFIADYAKRSLRNIRESTSLEGALKPFKVKVNPTFKLPSDYLPDPEAIFPLTFREPVVVVTSEDVRESIEALKQGVV